MLLHVVPRDAPAVAGAGNLREIHAVLLGDLASSRCRTAVGWRGAEGAGGAVGAKVRRVRQVRVPPVPSHSHPAHLSHPPHPSHRPCLDHPQHFPHLHVLAVLARDLREHARRFGADLEIDLVGLELDEHVAGGDAVAFVLHPARDARFDHRFTELRNDDIHMD